MQRPLRGGREDGRLDSRLDRLSRCCAASRRGDRRAGVDSCICTGRVQSSVAVEGIKASGVVLVEPSRVPGEGEEEGLLMRRGCWPDGLRGAQCGLQERFKATVRATGETCRLALHLLRLVRCSKLRVIRSMGQDHPSHRQHIVDTDRAATEPSAPSEGEAAEMLHRDWKRRARTRPPPPTAATMRARRMMEAMKGTELRASRNGARTAVTERGGTVPGRRGRSHSAKETQPRSVKHSF